jgi:hypothetical protein
MLRAVVHFVAGFVVLACASDAAPDHASGGAGGAGGASTGATASSAGGAGGAGGGGRGGSSTTGGGDGGRRGDGGESGGADASLSGDSGGAAPVDASDGAREAGGDDARVRDATAEGDGNPGGDTLPGKPWIHLCPKTDTHEQCCAFLCSCLMTVCADSPMDKPGIDNCMSNCTKLSDMAMRCHVYHCYESQNPRFPQDHISHCGHASGRVAGGGCPPEVYGP